MRLSEWGPRAPHRDSLTPKVIAVVAPVLAALGAGSDPDCWIAWGDDPAARYLVLAPAQAGLVIVNVRVSVPQEGPRASGKLVRWSRVQTGELTVEVASGHRLLGFQVEGQVLRGTDAEADAIAAFATGLFAAMDGRPPPAPSAAAGKGLKAGAGGSKIPRLPAPKGRTS